MNKVFDVKTIAMNAMIACVYVVLTIAIAPIAYGGIQMRISEIMIFLAFYNKKYIPGLVIGCFIANMASPMGIWDMCFGTIATVLACIAMYQTKYLLIGALSGGMINGLIVGAELYFAMELPFIINAFYVFIGEFAVLIVGAVLFKLLEKNDSLMSKYIYE